VHLNTVQAEGYVDIIILTDTCEVRPGAKTIQNYRRRKEEVKEKKKK
jgi:hypothetical protein